MNPLSELAPHLRALHRSLDLEATSLAAVEGVARLSQAASALLLVADPALASVTLAAVYPGRTKHLAPSFCLSPDLADLLSTAGDPILIPTGINRKRLGPLLANFCPSGKNLVVALARDGLAVHAVIIVDLPTGPCVENGREFASINVFLEQVALAIKKAAHLQSLGDQIRGLSAIAALDDAVARAPGFEEMLGEVIARIKRLIDTEFAGLLLYDAETAELVLQKPVLGASEELIRQYRVAVSGNSQAATVFRTGEPYLSNDLSANPSMRWFARMGIRTVISVPVEVKGDRIGVLHVANKRAGEFTDGDLRLANLVSSHLGIQIHNSQLVDEQRQGYAKLEQLNGVIDRQREGLQRTLAIHDELTRMVLDGQDVSAIAATLSQLVSNPVTVVDRFGYLVGQYPLGDRGDLDEAWRQMMATGTPRQTYGDASIRSFIAKLKRERRPVRMEPMPELGFDKALVAAPITVGRETLGYVAVLESNRRLDDLDYMAFQQASTAIALRMMKEKAAVEAQFKLRAEFVAELLGGEAPNEVLLSRASYLGIDLRCPRVVLLIDYAEPGETVDDRAPESVLVIRSRLLAVTDHLCRRYSPGSTVCAGSDEVIVIAGLAGDGSHARHTEVEALASELRKEIHRWRPNASVSIAISSRCESIGDFARSYRDARIALGAIRASTMRDQTLSFDQMGVYHLLLEPRNQQQLSALVGQPLQRLIEHDSRHGSGLVETLDHYLKNDCRLDRTRSVLHVHLNTLRYRLRRIGQISGVDVHTLDGRLTLHLALKLLHANARVPGREPVG